MKQIADALAGLAGRIDTPEPIVIIDTLRGNVSRMQEFADSMRGTSSRLEVVVEVDCGARRSGVAPEVAGELAQYAAKVGPGPGRDLHLSRSRGQQPRRPDPGGGRAAGGAGHGGRVAPGGRHRAGGGQRRSTPTVEYSDRAPITEIRPGEYVFGDGDNVGLGSCTEDQVALFVAATVVSDTMPDHVIVDVGTKALGREGSPQKGYGRAISVGDGRLLKLNEYHGFLAVDLAHRRSVGTVLPIVPNHVCPVVNNFDQLVVTDAAGRRLERWTVAARGV